MTNYMNLLAWQRAMLLVKEVYLLTRTFPKEELFALTSQIKRAATSVPANIAEGCGRNTSKDTIHFLHIARGSLYELETLLHISVSIELLPTSQFSCIYPLLEECQRLLNGLIERYKKMTEER